jgi:hypothetical protein
MRRKRQLEKQNHPEEVADKKAAAAKRKIEKALKATLPTTLEPHLWTI